MEARFVCPSCDYHYKIGSKEYFEILFDDNKFTELDANLISDDPLNFVDSKPYTNRITESIKKSGLKDAVRTAYGQSNGRKIVVACMDFGFIGGSMGSVVGEKIARAIDHARANKMPLIIISKSGGARMMEAAFSLMQMAKTNAALTRLAKKRLPYISVLTDPTMGGVSAGFAFMGDVVIAEPKALIGFAGPRVIENTVRVKLPEGFQRAEFLQEKGAVDLICDRRELRERVANLMAMLQRQSADAVS